MENFQKTKSTLETSTSSWTLNTHHNRLRDHYPQPTSCCGRPREPVAALGARSSRGAEPQRRLRPRPRVPPSGQQRRAPAASAMTSARAGESARTVRPTFTVEISGPGRKRPSTYHYRSVHAHVGETTTTVTR